MKKIIKLNEQQLTNLVKRIVKEMTREHNYVTIDFLEARDDSGLTSRKKTRFSSRRKLA